jgi:hypothetical protein
MPFRPLPPQSYTLYLSLEHPDSVCAVREEEPFPSILSEAAWTPFYVMEPEDKAPDGFDKVAAAHSCRVQGFYIFHWQRRSPEHLAASA